MTDQQKLAALLKEWKVPFRVSGDKFTNQEKITIESEGVQEGPVTGYIGFITEFMFSPEGKFINMGIWE